MIVIGSSQVSCLNIFDNISLTEANNSLCVGRDPSLQCIRISLVVSLPSDNDELKYSRIKSKNIMSKFYFKNGKWVQIKS